MITYYQGPLKKGIQYKMYIQNTENECYKEGYFEQTRNF